ncbi:MAG: protein kinase, partial [Planctomycetales bacterium]|nr:protein kinase [Planctomycetales bacterium]
MTFDKAEADQWRRGDVISNDFKVVRRLGHGGMASVYLVRNIDLGHRAAVKVPFRRYLESRETRSIFSREVQTWIALPKHPHLVQCYFLRESNELPIVFAEFVPAGSLESWITKKRIRGLPHLLDLAIQLTEAMRVSESNGIVHRDLKPSNCLLDESGRIKVGDFGLAASRESIQEQQLHRVHAQDTVLGFSAGSQSYCSPEQFEGAPVDISTDIWSFAVTLYEMISGRRPGLGPAAPHAIRKYRASAESRSVPGCIWDFLLDLLEPDPAKRPQSFAIVGQRLRELFREVAGHEYERQFPAVDGITASPEKPGTTKQSSSSATPKPIEKRHLNASILAELANEKESARRIRENLDHDPSGIQGLYQSLSGVANAHRKLGNLHEAISAYSECIEHLRELFQKKPNDATACMLLGTLHDRAVCRRQSGDSGNAIKDYDLCIKIFGDQTRLRFGHPFLNLHAGTYQNRAMASYKEMRLPEALSDATKAIEIRRRLVNDDGQMQYAIDLAGTLINRAVIYRTLGDSTQTLRDYSEAQRLCELPTARGQFTQKSEVLPYVFLNRAALYLAGGNGTDAKQDCDEAIRLFEDEWQATKNTHARINLSNAYNNRANAQRHLGNLAEAIADIGRCREIRQELVEQDGHANVIGPLVRAFCNEALFQLDSGKSYEALATLNRAIPILQSVIERADRIDLQLDWARLHMLRGTAHAACGQLESADEDLDAAAQIYERILDSGSVDVASGLLEVLQVHVGVALEWAHSDRRPTSPARRPLDAAARQSILNRLANQIGRISKFSEFAQTKSRARTQLATLRLMVESLHQIDRSRAGMNALDAIDR